MTMSEERKEMVSAEQQATCSQKKQAKQRFIPAGQKSTILSENRKRRMPSTAGYSDETKVYCPVSRGI